jgi:hypothetical protein
MRLYRSVEPLLRLVIATLALVSAAGAEESLIATPQPNNVSYGVDVGIGETDNVTLVPTDTVNQTIAITDLDFSMQQATRLLDADLKGNFSYLDYLQHAYSADMIGRFDGVAHAALIPERLTWTLQDDFGQGQINAFAAPTPDNRENINYLSTGPNLWLRFAGTGFFELSARYARAQYSISPFDSNRVQGSFELGDQLSARSSVSLNGVTEHVYFDNTSLSTDFNRTSAYAHYEISGARTDLIANLGGTEITQNGSSTTYGPLAKLQVNRKVSPATSVSFSVGRELTDASTGFSIAQTGAIGAISTTPAAATANSYTSNYASLGWNYERHRTTFALTGRWEKDSYASQPELDVTRGGGEFNLAEKLTHTLSVQVLGSLYTTNFAHANFVADEGGSSFQDARIGGALTLREGRTLEFRLRFDHISRAASANSGDIGFHANTIFLTVGYRPQPAAVIPD